MFTTDVNSLSGLRVAWFLPKLTSLTASYNQLTSVVLESSKPTGFGDSSLEQ